MNYYNPYMGYPYMKTSGISGFFKNFSFGNLLNGTQKTLNLINQAIPIVRQIGPVMKNAKTMFRVMNEFKKVDIKEEPEIKQEKKVETNGPTFFI